MNIVNILRLKSLDVSLHSRALDNLYSCFDYSKTRYDILKNEQQLDDIQQDGGYISVQFQGIPFLIFFTTIDNIQYNILISKKELKIDRNKNNLREMKMYNLPKFHVNNKYYSGTIIDGKIIKTQKMNHSFMIHEIYNGHFENMELKEKYSVIEKDFIPHLIVFGNKIDFKIVRLYNHDELPSLLFEKLSKSQHKIIGLMFLSRITKSYYVYTNEMEFNSLKDKKPYVPKKTYHESLVEFNMKNSDNPDVYYLYDINDNEKVGLAHIPDIKTSHFFKNIFKDKNIARVKCIRSEKFNKWIPTCDEYMEYSQELF